MIVRCFPPYQQYLSHMTATKIIWAQVISDRTGKNPRSPLSRCNHDKQFNRWASELSVLIVLRSRSRSVADGFWTTDAISSSYGANQHYSSSRGTKLKRLRQQNGKMRNQYIHGKGIFAFKGPSQIKLVYIYQLLFIVIYF